MSLTRIRFSCGAITWEDSRRRGQGRKAPRTRTGSGRTDWKVGGPVVVGEGLAGFGMILGGIPRQDPNREVGQDVDGNRGGPARTGTQLMHQAR